MSLWYLLRVRLVALIYCRLRGKCVVCSKRAPRWGKAYGVCDYCLGVERDSISDAVTDFELKLQETGDEPWADDLRSGDAAPSPSSPVYLMDATLAALENYPRLRSVYLEEDE